MQSNKKVVRRLFFISQREKEEKFLKKMSAEGWHLVSVKSINYTFIKGEPQNFTYQYDYVTQDENTSDYHLLFKDAGWEEICGTNGLYNGKWYYFRKECNGKEEKIYTDNESKYNMYSKLLKHYGTFMIGETLLVLSSSTELISGGAFMRKGIFGTSVKILVILSITAFILCSYTFIRLVIERRKLTKKKEWQA